MSGALHHIQACSGVAGKKKLHEPIRPIAGVEAYFRPDRSSKESRQAWHLCLFAKNLRGWHNLMRLVSISNAEIEEGGGFYQYPTVDFELLNDHREGIICTSACISSFLAQLIEWGDSTLVNDYIDTMLSIFGDDFWLEIMPHDFDDQRNLNIILAGIAIDRSIPMIATNDAHFPTREWADTQRVAKVMGSGGKTLDKANKAIEEGEKGSYLYQVTPTLYLAHEEEMYAWFQNHHPELPHDLVEAAMENTGVLAESCEPFVLDKSPKLPKIPDLEKSSEATLREWIEEGLDRIFDEYPEAHWERWPKASYLERVEYELGVLTDKGVVDYFVMLGDAVRWAKSQGIRVGLGRGSAAGCLISYLVGITAVDPISWGLLFERFLNPERRGLPDIDMDFDSERRHEIKTYLSSKYGADHVADIITHSRFQPKKVIGDLARVYGIPIPRSRLVTDSIEIRADDEETTLEEIVLFNGKLKDFKDEFPDLWEHALRLEGTVANAGKHAAGIIVTPKPIAEYMALERGKRGDLVTSWSDSADFAAISDYGFLKYDFLGITGLTKHEYACKLIEERTGERVDLLNLPVLRSPYEADEDVLRGFSEGHTIGIFQFASRGMTNLLREIQPDTPLDLVAANALYRPGPMKGGVTWDYAKRKHNIFLRTYWNDEVKPILKETYGIVAYQEQVMEISKRLANFSGAEADDLRKAMGKLYRIKGGSAAREFMGTFEEKWFSGTAAIGVGRKVADEIWHKMLEFGSYGFNKSHSACYALHAYQDMYLKVKYPAEFYAALLTYEDDEDKKRAALREASMRGIEIILPDVNKSSVGYTVDDEGRLVLGLAGIKGVGPNGAQEIIRKRPFTTLVDLLQRAGSKINLRPLVESGACDRLPFCERAQLLSIVPKPISDKRLKEITERGEIPPVWDVLEHLKHNMKLKQPRPIPDALAVPTDDELMRLQAGLLRLPVSSLNLSEDQIEFIAERAYTQEELADQPNGATVIIGGEITKIVRKKTKKGAPFANVHIVFSRDEWVAKFWQAELARFDHLLQEGRVVMISGKKDEWQGFVTVVAKEVADIDRLTSQPEETNASPS